MKFSKLKSWFILDYRKALSHNPLFWWLSFSPLFTAIFMWVMLNINGTLGDLSFSEESLLHFWNISKLPIYLASSSAAIAALIATIHRSGQLARASNQSDYYEKLKQFRDFGRDYYNTTMQPHQNIRGGVIPLFNVLFSCDSTYRISPKPEIAKELKIKIEDLANTCDLDSINIDSLHNLQKNKFEHLLAFLNQKCRMVGLSQETPSDQVYGHLVFFLGFIREAYTYFDPEYPNPIPESMVEFLIAIGHAQEYRKLHY